MVAVTVLAQSADLFERVQTVIFDANLIVAAGLAFVAGLISFASPCVVPLVPGYLSYMTGLSGEEIAEGGAGRKGRVLLGSTLFVLGFAIPFVLLGVAFGAVNFLVTNVAARVVMGVIVAVLGLLMASGRLMREFRVADKAPDNGLAGAPVLGFVFGLSWTPCLGPTAGAIFTLAAVSSTGAAWRGGALAFVYALGLGVPFILFGVLFKRMTRALSFLRRNARRLQIAGGLMLAVVGVAIATGWWNDFITALRPLIGGFETPL
jgi:cytochrome c-type biogenesis protein